MGLEKSEFAIETEILTFLNSIENCFAFKVETGGYYNSQKGFFQKRKSRFAIKGTADIIGTLDGKFFALEVKSKTGKLSTDQAQFLIHVKSKGAISGVVRSIEDALNVLKIPHPISLD